MTRTPETNTDFEPINTLGPGCSTYASCVTF